jgi:hypothetical protein
VKLRPYTAAVPLEGHWERQHSPLRRLRRRELRAMSVVAVVLLVAAAVALYGAVHHGAPRAAAGCVSVTAASSTGGATIHACGAGAVRLCRARAGRDDPFARSVAAACRRAGVP